MKQSATVCVQTSVQRIAHNITLLVRLRARFSQKLLACISGSHCPWTQQCLHTWHSLFTRFTSRLHRLAIVKPATRDCDAAEHILKSSNGRFLKVGHYVLRDKFRNKIVQRCKYRSIQRARFPRHQRVAYMTGNAASPQAKTVNS